MESVIFTLEQLKRLTNNQLKILISYYNIPISKSSNRASMINSLDNFYRDNVPGAGGKKFEDLNLVDVDLGALLLPDETQEEPRYSHVVRRNYWYNHPEELEKELKK